MCSSSPYMTRSVSALLASDETSEILHMVQTMLERQLKMEDQIKQFVHSIDQKYLEHLKTIMTQLAVIRDDVSNLGADISEVIADNMIDEESEEDSDIVL